MKHSEFIKALEENQDTDLVFDFENKPIRRDYHITEVLSANISAIDCGKGLDQWSESIIQLFEPTKESTLRSMSVGKALGIFKKSSKVIAIPDDAKVILEFRPDGAVAAQRYNVADVSLIDGKLYVHSEGATTQCKLENRGGCC